MTTETYHRRNLIFPVDLCTRVSHWHGGQSTMAYSLCSTGQSDYVSASMADAAADELDRPGKFPLSAELQADCDDLVGELRAFVDSASEHTTEAAGLEDVDSGYATWLVEN